MPRTAQVPAGSRRRAVIYLTARVTRIWTVKMLYIRQAIRQQLLVILRPGRVQGLEVLADFGSGFGIHFAAIYLQNAINKITH
jgi:hypothetical protein